MWVCKLLLYINRILHKEEYYLISVQPQPLVHEPQNNAICLPDNKRHVFQQTREHQFEKYMARGQIHVYEPEGLGEYEVTREHRPSTEINQIVLCGLGHIFVSLSLVQQSSRITTLNSSYEWYIIKKGHCRPILSSTPLQKNPEQGQSLVTGKAGTNGGRLHSTIAITMKVCERLEPDALSGLLKH